MSCLDACIQAARKVADFLKTDHHEFHFTVQVGLAGRRSQQPEPCMTGASLHRAAHAGSFSKCPSFPECMPSAARTWHLGSWDYCDLLLILGALPRIL
jgi:hypothetical protein